MTIRLAHPLQTDSIVDGIGIRSVIWTQGCGHKCPGCHNPETHSFQDGFVIDLEDLKKEIASLKMQDGITFSGGDPMYQPGPCLELAKFCKKQGLNIWCYTGYTLEELISLSNPAVMEFLQNIDVLIDGPFRLAQRSLNLKFRGSRNQRVIDMPATLSKKEIVLIESLMEDNSYVTEIEREVYV